MTSQDNCKNYDPQTLLAKISSFNIWLRNVFKEMMMNNQYVKRKKTEKSKLRRILESTLEVQFVKC